MVLPLCLFLAATAPLPRECEQPPLREVGPIKELANLDGAFSAGLDAVATWCFDSAGAWNGGAAAAKPKKGPPAARAEADVPPQGDCLKAITSCESTFETVKNKAPLRELAANAMADFDRPYRGSKYVPKRSGLKEVPSEAANCRSKSRTELFAMAQQRMDVARLNSQIQNEYANYKTWMFARGLECRNDLAAGKKDPTRVGVSVDTTPVAPPPVVVPELTSKDPELAAALKAPMLDKWKVFSKFQAKAEGDRDFTLGFLASRELRGCDCTRVNPAAVVRALEKKGGGEAGVALLTADDPANTRCAVCMFEVFPLWSARAQKQCIGLDAMADADLAKLEKSDDVNGLPPRCLDETKARRAEAAKPPVVETAKVPVARDGGAALVAMAVQPATATVAPVPTSTANPNSNPNPNPNPATSAVATVWDAGSAAVENSSLQTVDGYTYYRPAAATKPTATPPPAATPAVGGSAPAGTTAATRPPPATAPAPAPAAPLAGGPGVPTGPNSYTAPSSWAPIPQREDGRIYVRVFMSSACVADIEPGPIQARTGDLLLLPFEARAVQVKSPCGGLAEVYFGREARPRVSENFGSNRPVKFEFKRE